MHASSGTHLNRIRIKINSQRSRKKRSGIQARSQVLKFGGAKCILGGHNFCFIVFLKQIFLGTRKFWEAKEKFGGRYTRIPPMATGLVVSSLQNNHFIFCLAYLADIFQQPNKVNLRLQRREGQTSISLTPSAHSWKNLTIGSRKLKHEILLCSRVLQQRLVMKQMLI